MHMLYIYYTMCNTMMYTICNTITYTIHYTIPYTITYYDIGQKCSAQSMLFVHENWDKAGST